MIKLSERTFFEILAHEGIVRQTYYDSEGIPTWGAGVTDKSGHKVGRYWNNPVSMERVMDIFVWLIHTKYLPAVLKAFEGHDLSEDELAAALSFHWNTGRIHNATWVKNVKAGNYALACTNIMQYRSPASIIPRREAERDLFFKRKWTGSHVATEYTRLTKSKRPDWSSGRKVDITAPLRTALEKYYAGEQVAVPEKTGFFASLFRKG